MILYGAGGHAKNVYDALKSQKIPLSGIFDDNPQNKFFFSIPVISQYNPDRFHDEKLIISIGDNAVRHRLSKSIKHEFGTVIHQCAYVCENVTLACGTVVMANATVQSDVQIGRHCIINTGAIVEHECVVEDFVHIGPGVTICGNVHIGEGAFIGANATILPGVQIGKKSVIGAGAVVLKDVRDGNCVIGNPAVNLNK